MRNCEYIGNPAMFRSRVSGLGSIQPGGHNPYDPLAWRGVIDQEMLDRGIGGPKAAVCHKQSPAGTCKPVDWTPPAPAPAPDPAKPTASALPLLIGAAFLLLA